MIKGLPAALCTAPQIVFHQAPAKIAVELDSGVCS